MQSSDPRDTEVLTEIQKTLVSINDITMKIRREVDMINEVLKENGQYETKMAQMKLVLRKRAEVQGLNVNDILSKGENETQLELPENHLAALMEKLSSCVNEDL